MAANVGSDPQMMREFLQWKEHKQKITGRAYQREDAHREDSKQQMAKDYASAQYENVRRRYP